MKFDTFIFDLDGTLVEFNLNFDKIRSALNIKGKYVLESLMGLGEEVRIKKMEKLKEFEIDAAKKARLVQNADRILNLLEKNGYRKGVVTRNCRESVEIILNRFGINLDFVITREDAEPKPSPAPVLMAIKFADSKPEKSIMIGDYRFDIIAGRNAGVKTVLLLTEKNKQEEFVHLADYVIECLDELEKFI